MVDVTKETKIALIERNILMCKNTIYDLEIRSRIAVKIKDDGMKKQLVTELEKQEKSLDELNVILKEVQERPQ